MKNKKIIALAVAIAVSGAAFLFYLKIAKPPKVGNLPELILYGGVAYLGGEDIDKTWEKIKATKFYSQIIASGIFDSAEAQEVDPNTDKAKWLSPENILSVLGKEAFLGIFFNSNAGDSHQFDVVLLNRISRADKAKEPILNFVSRLNRENKISAKKYKGFRLNTVKQAAKDESLFYLILRDVVILSNSQRRVEQAVDLFRGEYQESIGRDANFKRLKGDLAASYKDWAYIDVAKLMQLMRIMNPEQAAIYGYDDSPVENYLFGFSLDDGLRMKGLAYFNLESELALKALWGSVNNTNLEILKFMPLDAAFFTAGNMGEPGLFWSYLKDKLTNLVAKAQPADLQAGLNNPEQFLSSLNELLGFDIGKDLLPYLGKEYAFSLAGFKKIEAPVALGLGISAANTSFPELLACIEVRDKEKIDNLMQGLWQRMAGGMNDSFTRLEDSAPDEAPDPDKTPAKDTLGTERKPPVSVERKGYSGANICFLKFNSTGGSLQLPEDLLSPAFVLADNHLIVSSNTALLRKALGIFQQKNLGINDSINFSQVRNNLPAQFCTLAYADIREVIGPLLDMLSPVLNNRAEGLREEGKYGIEKFIKALDIARNLRYIGATTKYEGNLFCLDIFVPLE